MSSCFIQATAVSIKNHAILIEGSAGVGKTTLALQLMENGAKFISDDLSLISLDNNVLFCNSNVKRKGELELRGLGIIGGIPTKSKAPILCIVHLHPRHVNRFPLKQRYRVILGKKVPVFDFFACATTYIHVLYLLKVLQGQLTLIKE